MNKDYHTMSNEEKYNFIQEHYHNKLLSFAQIAEIAGTYARKIQRDANKLGIEIRTNSQAQTIALASGRREHPTAGKPVPSERKRQIGKSVSKSWEELSESEKIEHARKSKETWNNRSYSDKEAMLSKARAEIQKASIYGSKLEKFLREQLIDAGYQIEFHKKYIIVNSNIHIDIFIPLLKTIIEVDGPQHQEPVWGEANYKTVRKSDRQKNGLLIGAGYNVIRIRGKGRTMSFKKQEILWNHLVQVLENIKLGKFESSSVYYIDI